MNLKEKYYNKVNSLMEKLSDEEPEDVTEVDDEPDIETSPEQGQAETAEIFFDNLDEETQRVVMETLRSNLKVAEDDAFGNQKIVEALAGKPLFTIRAEELVRQLNIDV